MSFMIKAVVFQSFWIPWAPWLLFSLSCRGFTTLMIVSIGLFSELLCFMSFMMVVTSWTGTSQLELILVLCPNPSTLNPFPCSRLTATSFGSLLMLRDWIVGIRVATILAHLGIAKIVGSQKSLTVWFLSAGSDYICVKTPRHMAQYTLEFALCIGRIW